MTLQTSNANGAINYDQIKNLEVKIWNPFTGCTKTSPGCKHCYAEAMALKLKKWGTSGYDSGFDFVVQYDRLNKAPPLKRKKPTLYFINSMSDTFHEDAKDSDIDRVIEIIENARWHNFYILTKRSDRMRSYFKQKSAPENLWMGVTVDDREYGLPRLEDLHRTNRINKHICCEPFRAC